MDSGSKKIKLDDSAETKALIESNVVDLMGQSMVTDIDFNKTITQKLMAANPMARGKADITEVINEGVEQFNTVGLPQGSGEIIGDVLSKLAAKQSKMIVTMSSYLLLRSQQMSMAYNIRAAHLNHLNSVETYSNRVAAKTSITLMVPFTAHSMTTKYFDNTMDSVKTWFMKLSCWNKFSSKEMNPIGNVETQVDRTEEVVKKINLNTDSSGNCYFHIQLHQNSQGKRVKQLFYEERNAEPYSKIFVNFEISRKERDVCKSMIQNLQRDPALSGNTISRVSFQSGRLGIKVKSGLVKYEYAIFSLTHDIKIKSLAVYTKLYNQEFGSDKNYVIYNGSCVLVPEE